MAVARAPVDGVAPALWAAWEKFAGSVRIPSRDLGLVPFRPYGTQSYLIREILQGLSEGVRYFVIADNLTADDFQISDEKGGSAAAFSADVTDGTWTFALPPASLAVASIADDEVGADGRFQYTFSPEDADVYLVLTALNVDDEESDATTTVYRFGMSGGGRSYGKAAPPKDARNTSDPFGAL